MTHRLLAGVLCAWAATAGAQSVTGALFFSHDSDNFDEYRASAGYVSASGFGAAVGAMRYTAPGWSANGALLAGTYTEQAPLRQLEASIGAAQIDGDTYLVGGADYLQRWQAGHALGVAFERNIVNSQGGIEDGIVYNSLALVGDYAFSTPFNVGLAGGSTYFTDGNYRPFLRTRWNYAIEEQYALNAYLKTRSYRNSDPDRPQYYSPEWLNEVSLGLSSRWRASDQVVLSASLDGGMQYTNSDDQPIWGAFLGLASPRHLPIRWSVGVLATNTASLMTTQSGAYRYLSATAQLIFPL